MASLKDSLKGIADKYKDLFAKHKISLSIEEPPAPKTFLATGKLKDGSEIHTTAEKFDAGADCYFKDAEGKESPVPTGEYELESGEVIVVADGIITEVKAGSGGGDTETEEMKAAISELKSAYETEIQAITKERDELKSEADKLKVDLKAANEAKAKAEAKAVELGKQTPPKPGAGKKEDAPVQGFVARKNPLEQKFMEGLNAARNAN